MKKTANKTKRQGKSTTHIKKYNKPNKSKKSKKSKRATNKPTRNSKTFKKTYLSKKQRALKQLQNAIKNHILSIIRAHKTKRKQAGGNSCSQELVGGGKFGADTIANSIAAFFKWLQKVIASIFGGKPRNSANMEQHNQMGSENNYSNNYSNPNNNQGIELTNMKDINKMKKMKNIAKQFNSASQLATEAEITKATEAEITKALAKLNPAKIEESNANKASRAGMHAVMGKPDPPF